MSDVLQVINYTIPVISALDDPKQRMGAEDSTLEMTTAA